MSIKKWIALAGILAGLVLSVGLAVQASPPGQGPGLRGDVRAQGGLGIAASTVLSTSFTYQGQLKSSGEPVNEDCSMAFRLYDGESGGSQVGSAITRTVPVSDGLFTVDLDFGSGVFTGDARWLGIRVQCSGDTEYADLGRQALTAAPYALYALSTGALQGHPVTDTLPATDQVLKWNGNTWVPATDINTTYTAGAGLVLDGTAFSVVTSTIQGRVTEPCGAGSAIRQVNADGSVECETDDDTTYTVGAGLALSSTQFLITYTYRLPQGCGTDKIAEWDGSTWVCGDDDVGGGNTAWLLSGNLGTDPENHYVGTSDGVTLTLAVSGTAALRLVPDATSPNVIGGHSANSVGASAVGATIGGGGGATYPNRVTTGTYGTIGGGLDNTVSAGWTTVSGGHDNTASGPGSTVGGGYQNTASDFDATIAGGRYNTASSLRATIGGGEYISVTGQAATVAGGSQITVSGDYAAVGGGTSNVVTATYATVAGGGQNTASGTSATVGGGWTNTASGIDATVGGGARNIASGTSATVGGGESNVVTATYATVAGGGGNTAGGYVATVGGGYDNTASSSYATVGGGRFNTASGDRATVGGGYGNVVTGTSATVGGGGGNTAAGYVATVGGGYDNTASNSYATVGGGRFNTASGDRATVGGGYGNVVTGTSATVGGGEGNVVTATYATVGGGGNNTAGGTSATIAGGYNNAASSIDATVGGGAGNAASSLRATVGGGYQNTASGDYAAVGGGSNNTASGNNATVAGGANNAASGDYSFAAGRRAKANHDGSFVWGDSTVADINSSGEDQFIVRANGGIWFGTAAVSLTPTISSTIFISTSTGAYLSDGGDWTNASSRDLKENYVPIDGRAVLDRLAVLPMSTWNYRAEGPEIRHMGPVAQDFYGAFGLGMDDRHISTVDADGVALAAIQGLYELSQEQAATIETLAAERVALQRQLDALNARVEAIEAGSAGEMAPLQFLQNGMMPGAGIVLVGLGLAWLKRRGIVLFPPKEGER